MFLCQIFKKINFDSIFHLLEVFFQVFLLELKNFLKTLQDDHNPVYFLLRHLITSVSKLLELVDYVNIMIHQKHDCQEFLEHN